MIFTVIYNVVQHYYDEQCSHESWSSLLTPPLAENSWKTMEVKRFDSLSENTCFKRWDNRRLFTGVLSRYDTRTWIWTTVVNVETAHFSCLRKQTNSCFQLIGCCSASCFSVGTWEDTTKHSAVVSSSETSVFRRIVHALEMPLNILFFLAVFIAFANDILFNLLCAGNI